MFCSHCGKEVTVGAKFCPNCGAAIENQPAPTEGQPKAPTVEQTKNPIRSEAKSGKGKRGAPKPLVIVATVLVLFIGLGAVLNLFGDDNKPDSVPNESQTQPVESQVQPSETQMPQGIEESYREYNSDDFGRKHTLLRTIAGKDQQTVLQIYNMEGAEGGENAGLLFKTLFVDLEGNSGFDVTYIDTIGEEKILGTKQFYYKVTVEDIETFRNNVEWWTSGDHKVDASKWSKDDEIYLQCDFFPPAQQTVQFYFRFKNYSVDESQGIIVGTGETPTVLPNETEPPVTDLVPDDFWAGHWIGTDEGVEMTVTAITDGYQIIIRETYDTNAIEYRLTGIDCLGLIDCEGEEWTIQYSDNGETTETLVGNYSGLLVEKSSEESGYSVRFEGPGGEHVLRFLKWGEPLPDWYVRDDGEYED